MPVGQQEGACTPEILLRPRHILAQCWPRTDTCLPTSVRRESLRLQGTCLADDQVSHGLSFIAGCVQDVQVLEPHLALKCLSDLCPDPLRAYMPAMTRGCKVITCVPLKGHWVSFAWFILGGAIGAWVSMQGSLLAEEISVLHWLWGKASGLSCRAFRFSEGPLRPPVPGLCGHYALADLCCWALCQPFQDDHACLATASTIF